MKCERCGTESDAREGRLFDYCAACAKNLCPDCMEEGCCDKQPAESGMDADYGDGGRNE